jgi:hypothetical protein
MCADPKFARAEASVGEALLDLAVRLAPIIQPKA